ncbi:ESX secretion-associated protein EspG [Parasphingorhabdus pacifica]
MAVSGRWQLHPLHLYLVRSYLQLDDLALPLEGASFGRTTDQLAEIARREAPTMESLGILVNDEVHPELARALRVLTKPYLWVDSLWFPDLNAEAMWRTVGVLTEGNQVILGVQPPGEGDRFGGVLTVEIHDNVPLSQVLLPTLPPAPPGNRSASVPAGSFREEQQTEDGERASFMQRSQPVPGRVSSGDQQLATYRAIGAEAHVRGGQLAANMRDRNGKVKRSTVLKWFDNAQPDGRYLDHNQPGSTGEPLYMLTPADARLIAGKIDELIALVR